MKMNKKEALMECVYGILFTLSGGVIALVLYLGLVAEIG
jgi:hypothetical protein